MRLRACDQVSNRWRHGPTADSLRHIDPPPRQLNPPSAALQELRSQASEYLVLALGLGAKPVPADGDRDRPTPIGAQNSHAVLREGRESQWGRMAERVVLANR